MGEVEFIFWVRFGGVYDKSSNYVGGDYELLLAKNNIDFDGFKKIISEFLNVGDSGSKMHFKFFTGHPVKPLYEVTDNRTLRLFMYYARQDPVKNSLMVTVEDEVFPSTKGIKNPSGQTKESPTSTEGYLKGPESISEGTNRYVFERDFDIAIPEDSPCVAATPQQSSPFVAANPLEDNPYVTTTPQQSSPFVAANPLEDNPYVTTTPLQSSPYVAASPLVEPYTNVPPIPHSVSHIDDNEAGSGDEKSRSEGVYGASSISDEIEEYKIFKSKKDLTTSLSIISMREKFQFKTFKSNSHFTIIRCLDTSCLWRVRAKRLEGSGYWMVTKYERKHTCTTDFKKVRYRQATSWVVGECVKKRLINPGRVFKPRDVIDDMKRKFGVDISYSVAWRGREYAYENLRLGTPEQSYSLLPGYLHMLRETNPGTVVNLEVGEQDRFKYLFIAFDASIKGFQYCRPVVSIDATHMKGKYRGVLFMAVCHDANQQIFPLAFGIGDSENDAAWTWFLRRIKDVFGERPGHVIVSDRHRSINNAVKEVFPNAFHGICMYHLLNNLKNKFKTKTKELEQHYIQTAKAYNLQEFHVLFYTLCCAVPGAKEYLERVGLDRWTRSHSPSRRYNIMTTNISESMNAALVKVRELPITAFVNEIRLLCQRWFFERRNKAKDFTSKMSKDVEKKLEKRRDRAQIMDVSCLNFFYLSFILIMLQYYINCMERKKKPYKFFFPSTSINFFP
ncbi:hypothetical protein UlMin_017812 [Ulmus minor]